MAGLEGGERTELLRLRTEVAELRAEVAQLRARPARTGPSGAARAGRWVAALLLLVLSSAAGVAAVVGVFARTELLDTDRYVETVAPLARDPVVQAAVADRVTDELVTRLDLAGLTQQLVDALERQGAPEALDALVGPVTSGIRSFLRTEVAAVLASDQFAQIWDTANRVAHDELDAVLTGEEGRFLSVQDNTVQLDLGAIFDAIKQRLVDAGFTLVNNLPELSVTVPLVASDQLPKLQQAVRLLEAAAWILPLAALALLAAALTVAPDRRRALLVGAVGLGIGMLLLLAAVAAGRTYYLDHLPDTVRSPDAAAATYDTLLRFLVAGAQSLLLLAAIVAVACWLVGPGRLATWIRRAAGWLLDRAAAGATRLRLPLGGVPAVVHRHRSAIEAALVVVALAVLVVWRHPGVAGTLWLAAGLLVALSLVELVSRLDGERLPGPAPASGTSSA